MCFQNISDFVCSVHIFYIRAGPDIVSRTRSHRFRNILKPWCDCGKGISKLPLLITLSVNIQPAPLFLLLEISLTHISPPSRGVLRWGDSEEYCQAIWRFLPDEQRPVRHRISDSTIPSHTLTILMFWNVPQSICIRSVFKSPL